MNWYVFGKIKQKFALVCTWARKIFEQTSVWEKKFNVFSNEFHYGDFISSQYFWSIPAAEIYSIFIALFDRYSHFEKFLCIFLQCGVR